MDYVLPNGWYYRSITDYDPNWTVANEFAKYWGVNYTTKYHEVFSYWLGKGDFITCDFEDNGSWDHWGFVTSRDTYKSEWSGGYCYFDYKVAEHSSDYHLWTSNADNNWELKGVEALGYGKSGRYGILYHENIH